MLGLVDDVGRGTGCNHEAAKRHFHRLALGTPTAFLVDLVLEHDGAQMTLLVGERLHGIHARRVANAFLERLLHFLVILPIGG